ncbi:hydroxyacid dehydrogenase [Tabrizicola sp.]|uniref:hydroxyacid dehydrogenase n=1 Tax=Tabrizicola sp. TaxID=2005166 RepID=UPI0027351D95|nr:hydroxyacid dehydrogenase [Tabrizicola sp.]MDP3194098.1 hydroxyacid dehydrogenase [Tabrizicola sp.]MDZ4088535.1 hydroxyacid dehydrogenase [Tabrizicola sp.]
MRVLYDPDPRSTGDIFSAHELAAFTSRYQVTEWQGQDRDAFYAEHLPGTDILISQQPMGADRLALAPNLRAIFNVETNFLPNIDYEECFRRGIPVLAPGGVFAAPVAEMALGMALSLARNIHGEHAAFLRGQEKWLFDGNRESEMLAGSTVGIIGFGDLGRALHRLLAPFGCRVQAHDPWLPPGHLRRLGVEPVDFDTLMAENRFIFVMAAITTENKGLIDAGALSLMQKGAMLLLMSRAAAVDFPALTQAASEGRIRVATDVFPVEPLPQDDPIRRTPNMLFSPHRAGALEFALREIGTRVLEDMDLIARGLAPVACRRAERETVARFRSKPVDRS